ncbi:unnamed protein product [Orchesella dallaii]|uniref:Gustatory receptor n=1 Tax=Orchesella dallaii TaxID=48710 RepID=A0ABP1PKV0_9HEXA
MTEVSNSIVTPKIRRAFSIYNKSFGLIPPFFFDIKLCESSIQGVWKFPNTIQAKLWTMFISALITFTCIGTILIFTWKFLYPTQVHIGVVDIGVLLLVFGSFCWLVILLWDIGCTKNIIPLLNKLFSNNLHYLSVFILCAICVSLTAHVNTLLSHNLNRREFLRRFIYLRVLIAHLRVFICKIAMDLVSGSLFILTVFAWFSVRGFFIFPLFIPVAGVSAFVGGLGIAIFALQEITSIREQSNAIIRNRRAQHHSFNRSRTDYYHTAKWKAQLAFPLQCGDKFMFSKGAIMDYLNVLSTNITNSVLLLIPPESSYLM